MSKQYHVQLSQKEIEILRELLETECYQMSGVAVVSPTKQVRAELTILERIKASLQAPVTA